MKKFISISVAACLTAAMCALTTSVAADAGSAAVRVNGEKVDSGLGDLPHYSQWADPTGKNPLQARSAGVTGEKVDSGLGELPHYRLWADPTGRNPVPTRTASDTKQEQPAAVQVSQAK